jgi:hypothetical protein
MKISPALVLVAGLLTARLVSADPAIRVLYPNGVPRVEIAGDYAQSLYTVWRGPAMAGPYEAVTAASVLCLGSCFAEDYTAVPGRTYWYRFDVWSEREGSRSYGPYAVTFSPELARAIGVRVSPNPGRGAMGVTLMLAGRPDAPALATEASVYDLQGRRRAVLHRGAMAPGATRVRWDGRGGDGSELPAGVYLLRFAAADGRSTVTRVVRGR